MIDTYDEMWTGDGIDWRCVDEEHAVWSGEADDCMIN